MVVVGLVGTLVMLADRLLGVVICVVGGGEGVLAASLQGLPSPGPDGSPGRQDECLENSGQHRAYHLSTLCNSSITCLTIIIFIKIVV